MLQHELALQAELDSAWAARPLALSHFQGRPALILEDRLDKLPGYTVLTVIHGRPLRLARG